MHPFEFKEGHFKPDSFLNYRVSIQLNLNGFSFCLKETGTGAISVFKNYPFRVSNENGLLKKVDHILKEEDLLAEPFAEVSVFADSKKFTLVPGKFFHPDLAAGFIEFNLGSLNHSKTGWNFMENNDLVLIYSFPEKLDDLLKGYFPNRTTIHLLCPLMNYLSRLSGNLSRFGSVCFGDSGFYLLIYEDTKPVFINFFESNHPDDLSFFMLSTLQQLGIEMDGLKVFVCGDVDKIPVINILDRRMPRLEFIEKDCERSDSAPFHKYFSHFI